MGDVVDDEPGFVSLVFHELPEAQMLERAQSFHARMEQRRTTRHFSGREVPRELIQLAVQTAGTAPSGAHMQPWTYVAVADSELKARMREAAEAEEKRFYEERMPDAWEEVLTPLGTDYVKAHITDAPWVVVLFRHSRRLRDNGKWGPTYYSQESCGISAGLFIAAVHDMGLVTLTHTPSPMRFLAEILRRPDHERPYLLIPVVYPVDACQVPSIDRKPLDQVLFEP